MLKYFFIPLAILLLLITVLLASQMTRMFLFEFIGGKTRPPCQDFASLKRPGSPNDFLMTPPGFDSASPDKFSPEFPIDAGLLTLELLRITGEMPRTRLVKREAGNRLQFEQRSGLFLFPDFFTIQVIALPGNNSTLAAYSGSVFGHSDLGVNRRRIEGIVEKLQNRIGG